MADVPPTVPPIANTHIIIDLSSKQGRNLYNKTVAPLTIHFNGDSKNVNMFP